MPPGMEEDAVGVVPDLTDVGALLGELLPGGR
jgi:hypothetical protein